jgi:hypothetical protein
VYASSKEPTTVSLASGHLLELLILNKLLWRRASGKLGGGHCSLRLFEPYQVNGSSRPLVVSNTTGTESINW